MSATDRFGPYELVRRLGSGGMAETFLAVRRGPGEFVQHVCVKRILPAFESDPELVAQFLEEARLAAQLRHGSIAQVVDFGEVEGSHYLALELIDGMDLRALIASQRAKQRTLPVPVVTHVAIRVAEALAFAHTPGGRRPSVIHRDVSPSNVLLSRSGEVYLIDFGIARAVGGRRVTSSGVVRGKVPYMAAEYARTGNYDARTDLFSLGVVLFEALTGQRPFDGQTDLDTLQRIQEGRRARLVDLAPHAPGPLVAAVERLLEPAPNARFESASALLDALAPVAPSPTIVRELGQLVRDSSESLSASLNVPLGAVTPAGAPVTAPAAVPPAPALPAVTPASAGAETRTADFAKTTREPSGTESLWSSTDPSRVSHHDRVSSPSGPAFAGKHPAITPVGTAPPQSPPLASTLPMQVAAPAPPAPPATHPPAKRRNVLGWLVVISLVVFALATSAAYAIVHFTRGGG